MKKIAKPKKRWVVYMLRCADASLYTGITNDLAARMATHLSGKGAKYTRGRAPLTVVFSEECRSKSAALKREAAIKALRKPQKLALIDGGTV